LSTAGPPLCVTWTVCTFVSFSCPHRTFSSQVQQLLPTRFSSALAYSCEERVGAGLNQAM
jgi:hypothetical protein